MRKTHLKNVIVAVVASVMSVVGVRSAHAKVELLDESTILLTGTINRGDEQSIADFVLADDADIRELIVSARGTGSTAWEVAHTISKLLNDHDIKVQLLYAEDAAIAIRGIGQPEKKGKQIAWKTVDINRNTRISVRIYEQAVVNGKSVKTSQTKSESLAPTVDQFDFICKERIPQEAQNLGTVASKVAGKKCTLVDRKGLRDKRGHVWYYVRTFGRGTWRNAEPNEIVAVVEKERKKAQVTVDRLRKRSKKKP